MTKLRGRRRKDQPPVLHSLQTPVQPLLIPDFARNADGSVDPEAADANTLLNVVNIRQSRAARTRWQGGRQERRDAAAQREDFDPQHDAHLTRLLTLSGADDDTRLWGPVFSDIASYDSPAMALYCFYVSLGWPEDAAYHAVYPDRRDHRPPDYWKERARPFIAALLSRLMPSRYRLLMHMEQLIADGKVDASVRSNMMQFLAKYLLPEAQGQGGGASVPAASGASEVVQSFVQEAILKRGGTLTLTLPPEPTVVDA